MRRFGATGAVLWCAQAGLVALGGCTSAPLDPPTAPEATTIAREPMSPMEATPPLSPTDGLPDAQRAIAEGRVDPAIEFLRSWTRAHPLDFPGWTALAHALVLAGDATAAREVLASIATQDPVAARRAATLEANLGDVAAAADHLEQAAQRWPAHLGIVGAQVWLATLTGGSRSPESQARIDRLYDAYAAGEADDAESLLAVARATLATRTNGGFHDANDVLERAYTGSDLTLDAGGTWLEEEFRLLHARVFIEKYAADEAQDLLRPLLDRTPRHVEARTLLAYAALTTGDLFEATALATEVLNDRPRAPGASLIIAWGHVVRGQEAAARELLSSVLPHTLWQDATARALHATLDIRGRTRGIAETVAHALSGPDPTGWYVFPQLAELLSHIHLYQELDEVLTLALDRDPTNFYTRSAYALNLLRLGNDDEGLRQMELAWDGDKFNERTFNTRALFRDVVAYEYELVRRDDVELRVPKGAAPVLADQLFDEIAAARRTFERRYGLKIPNVRVEVYRTPREFAVRTIGVPALGALGVCFGPVVTIVGPFSGRFNFSRVLWHELAHTYALAASQRRVPRWLTEGLSEWEAGQREPGWRAKIAEELATMDAAGALVPLSQLEGAFVLAEDHQAMSQAYIQATAAVEFLMTKLDDASLRDTLTAFQTGRPAVHVLPTVLRTSMNQLDAEYERWVESMVAATPAGWGPPSGGASAVDARVALWEAANEAFRRGDFPRSLQQIDLLEDADGEGYESAMLRGITLRETRAIPAAIRALERAEQFTDARSEHLVLRARIARDAGDAAAEQTALDTVLERDFSNAEAAARLILLSLASGAPAPDARHLERLRQIAPTSPRTLGARALALAATGQRRRANALVDLGLALDATDPDSLTLLALAARACRRPADARNSATRALQRPRISAVTRALIATTWPGLSRSPSSLR